MTDPNNFFNQGQEIPPPLPPANGAKIYVQKYVDVIPQQIREKISDFLPEALYYALPAQELGKFAYLTFDSLSKNTKSDVRNVRSFVGEAFTDPSPSAFKAEIIHVYTAYFFYQEEPCFISFLSHQTFKGCVILIHTSMDMLVRAEKFIHDMVDRAIEYWAKSKSW